MGAWASERGLFARGLFLLKRRYCRPKRLCCRCETGLTLLWDGVLNVVMLLLDTEYTSNSARPIFICTEKYLYLIGNLIRLAILLF